MTFRTTRRTLLLAGTAASATIAMPWIAKAAAEFPLKYANNSPLTHPMNVRAAEAPERIKEETDGRRRNPDLPEQPARLRHRHAEPAARRARSSSSPCPA